MHKYEVLEKLEETIEQNNNSLRSCQGHVFIKNEDLHVYIPRYICKNCGGIVGQVEKIYYELGVQHGIKVENTKSGE